MTEKSEDILRKVRGLLAKANATPFEAEADLFRAKADELMTAYAIEEWQIGQADTSVQSMKPIRKDFDFGWYYEDDTEALWSLFRYVADHCRCVIAHKNVSWAIETKYVIPVFGTQSDIDYLDMLFTNLMMQMSAKFKPVYDSSKTDAENIYIAKEAGMSWKDIAVWIGQPELIKYKADGKTIASISGYLKAQYRKWAVATGQEYHSANPKTYVRSFASGYVSSVREKLLNMREQQGQNTGSMALAVRDIKEQAREEMFDQLPNQKSRDLVRGRADNRRVDPTAMHKGREEGSKARIIGKGERDIGGRGKKQLN